MCVYKQLALHCSPSLNIQDVGAAEGLMQLSLLNQMAKFYSKLSSQRYWINHSAAGCRCFFNGSQCRFPVDFMQSNNEKRKE